MRRTTNRSSKHLPRNPTIDASYHRARLINAEVFALIQDVHANACELRDALAIVELNEPEYVGGRTKEYVQALISEFVNAEKLLVEPLGASLLVMNTILTIRRLELNFARQSEHQGAER